MSARVALISFWRHGNPLNPVGASLLAMAECQPISMLDVPASSRASSLPQVSVAPTNACHTTKQRWERACSRWRSVSRYQCWMCRPHREQARSHRFQWRPQMLVTPQNKGGSELARDGGVSASINAGCAGLIASRFAPTGHDGWLRAPPVYAKTRLFATSNGYHSSRSTPATPPC
ncbi:hypothetical protein PS893_00578 [Pseudomonas fluorescens]|nr:hypothetical protein PS893_00578 [Pseudomonas fluorescens]